VLALNKRIQELEDENEKLKNHIVSLESGKVSPLSPGRNLKTTKSLKLAVVSAWYGDIKQNPHFLTQ